MPFLRLVHSIERLRYGRPYRAQLRFGPSGPDGALPDQWQSVVIDEHDARCFTVGTGDRVDLAARSGLLPRHVAVLTQPGLDGVHIRVLSLHPERTVRPLSVQGLQAPVVVAGGVCGVDRVRVRVERFVLDVRAELHVGHDEFSPAPQVETVPPGAQLTFHQSGAVRPVGNVVSSIAGPGGGGHAIPALVVDLSDTGLVGALVLRARGGVHRVEPSPEDLQRGILIGRSRRCMLGRGFDENDGLSRLHALVVAIGDGIYAFDLASRYGLRDVGRPTRLIPKARLDDGAGCLVYGAGHLLFES